MSNYIITPNMNLNLPVPTVDPGPDWAATLNAALAFVDGHTHNIGSGVQITPSGLNINSNLPMNGNALIGTGFLNLGMSSTPATETSLYSPDGIDIWFLDGNGNNFAITSGGGVTASVGTLTGGTAQAAFVSNVLVVNSVQSTGVPGNITCQSVLYGNASAGTDFVTLSAPSSTTTYGLVLPTIPVTKSIMALDTSGNMSGAYTVDNSTIDINGSNQIEVKAGGITGTQLANATVDTTQLANGAVTYPKLGAAAFASSGSFSGSTSSTTPQAQSGSAVTITGQGRPIVITLAPIGTGGTVQSSMYNSSTSDWIRIDLYRGGSFFSRTSQQGTGGALIGNPTAVTWFDDTPTSGSITYEIYISSGNGGGTSAISSAQLVAYSL